jgi:hypothetical protein
MNSCFYSPVVFACLGVYVLILDLRGLSAVWAQCWVVLALCGHSCAGVGLCSNGFHFTDHPCSRSTGLAALLLAPAPA